MIFNKKLDIVISNDNQTVFVDRMTCVECRNFMNCNQMDNCKVYEYIQQRLPNTTLNEYDVIQINTKDYNKAITVVKRAIRLRSYKFTR